MFIITKGLQYEGMDTEDPIVSAPVTIHDEARCLLKEEEGAGARLL